MSEIRALAERHGAMVLEASDDLGPLLKLLPALDAEPAAATVVVTVDDDIEYEVGGHNVYIRSTNFVCGVNRDPNPRVPT